jgi:hypothetical protein
MEDEDSRGRCVEAPGELLQAESIADMHEGGCRPLVGDQCPQGLVTDGKAPHDIEHQDVLRNRVVLKRSLTRTMKQTTQVSNTKDGKLNSQQCNS